VIDRLVALLDAAGVDRACWIGYSMGGRVALAGAVLRPDRVSALVLESASPGLDDEAERASRRARDDALAIRLLERGIAEFVDGWMAMPLFASQRGLGEAALRRERSRRMKNDAAELAACLQGLGTGSQPSFWDRLPDVTVPTLIVTGELDARFTALGARMRERFAQARHEVVPGAGHAVHLERPDPWLGVVLPFLDAHARERGS
jgi:2-succinyl-6-hydroxy-2,4-cyclohexadiene-1-carboxylate synthase